MRLINGSLCVLCTQFIISLFVIAAAYNLPRAGLSNYNTVAQFFFLCAWPYVSDSTVRTAASETHVYLFTNYKAPLCNIQ